MKIKSVTTKLLIVQLLFWSVFSLILSSTPVSFQNVTITSDSFDLKSSAVDFSDATVISDGFDGTYWNSNSSYNPAVAVDNSNTVHVVWEDWTNGPWGTDFEIMYANYTSSTGWSNATVISDGFGGVYWNEGNSGNPAIAVDANYSIHVVWEDDTNGLWGTDVEIMYAHYIYNIGWSNATVISDGYGGVYWNNESSLYPTIVVDSYNVVHVVWNDDTDGPWGGDIEIMYANNPVYAGWSNATVVSDGFGAIYWNDGSSADPAIAVDSSNTVHVVWDDTTDGLWGTDVEIMYANYTIGTVWSNATVISDGYDGVYWNNESSYNPAVAIDSNNLIHVVWDDETDGPWDTDPEIMYANYTNTAGWSNVSVISDGFDDVYWNDDFSYVPAVAVDSGNRVHVVWWDFTDGVWGADSEIMYANYTNTAGWSNVSVISDGYGGDYWNDGSSALPDIAIESNYSIHVVWYDTTDGPWGTDIEIMHASIRIPIPVVDSTPSTQGIPYGNFYLLFIFVGLIGIIIYIKRKV